MDVSGNHKATYSKSNSDPMAVVLESSQRQYW